MPFNPVFKQADTICESVAFHLKQTICINGLSSQTNKWCLIIDQLQMVADHLWPWHSRSFPRHSRSIIHLSRTYLTNTNANTNAKPCLMAYQAIKLANPSKKFQISQNIASSNATLSLSLVDWLVEIKLKCQSVVMYTVRIHDSIHDLRH